MIFDGLILRGFGAIAPEILNPQIIGDNPFSKTVNSIWDLLEADATFVSMVPLGNRIKFTGNVSKPFKDNVTTADMPEVMVYCPNYKVNLQNSSSAAQLIHTYEIVMNTGDYRINVLMNKLQWLLLCIMHNGQSTLSEIEWNGERINKVIRVRDIQVGDNHGEHRDRGVKGFATLWACEIESYISHSDFVLTES